MMIEFEPGAISGKEAQAIINAIAVFHPGAISLAADALNGASAPVLSFAAHERTAEEAFASTAPAPAPVPDAAEAFAPLAAEAAPIAPEPVGSPPPPPSAAAPASSPSASAELDAAGVAWNPEIHTSTKAKLKDGTWRAKRNTSGAEPGPTPPAPPATGSAPPVVAPPVTSESAVPVTPGSAVTETPPAPPPPPVPLPPGAVAAAQAAAVAAATPRPSDFIAVMKYTTGLQSAGKIDAAKLGYCLTGSGIAGIAELKGKPELIPTFVELLDSYAAD